MKKIRFPCSFAISIWQQARRIQELSTRTADQEENAMANEMLLKYGCNPNQKPSRVYMEDGRDLPITVLNGKPGYINLLDAFNGWQLVRELKAATGMCAATSFKHVSPAGAAVGAPLSDTLKQIYFVDDLGELSPLACAYARARGADRMSSYGDFIALSDVCDVPTARMIQREVSDGVIAPGYEPEALEILKSKRKGTYNIIQIDESYVPAEIERKQVFGVTFEQGRNELKIDNDMLSNLVTDNKDIPEDKKRDLLIALITLKYTQSNSVCYVKDGQAIGIGAGQQSRIHCTRLAGNKADIWWLRQHPKVMGLQFRDDIRRPDRDNAIDVYISDEYMDVLADGAWENTFKVKPEVFTKEEQKEWLAQNTDVCLGSDAFFPFGDNIERAYKSGVKYIAEPGGSIRDDHVIMTCNKYGMAMAFTGIRLFHH
ncbi:MAG: phosphoribosylaminoimidazolecarboxamide formyltransferase [Ruminococcus sp.]|nr:phosphoribosylaminoimidazolecarboxamide formyltransferase [Ruminococcus sp.]